MHYQTWCTVKIIIGLINLSWKCIWRFRNTIMVTWICYEHIFLTYSLYDLSLFSIGCLAEISFKALLIRRVLQRTPHHISGRPFYWAPWCREFLLTVFIGNFPYLFLLLQSIYQDFSQSLWVAFTTFTNLILLKVLSHLYFYLWKMNIAQKTVLSTGGSISL